MNHPQQISYTIRKRDSLYRIAKYYYTTIPAILSQNPNIDPYNLQVGTVIVINPGERSANQPVQPVQSIYSVPSNSVNPQGGPDFNRQSALINNMRSAWEQHVYWTRMLLISIAEKLKDQSAVTDRLLQNPYYIANIFANYYNQDTAKKIARLLTEHLQIGAALITALRDKKSAEADNLTNQWYINADKMADAFASINPYYNSEELRNMLYTHLKLTTQEVAMRLAGNYRADIEAFNKVEQEALAMADYFSSGIIKQFPHKFN